MAKEQWQAGINEIQHLHFELFRHVRYNLLDGERVVNDLLEWRDLWYSVLPGRFPYPSNEPDDGQYHPYTELGMLRNVRGEIWPADTLYIWTNDEALSKLQQRIKEPWEPSEVAVISPDTDIEMRLANLNDEHDDRVLFV